MLKKKHWTELNQVQLVNRLKSMSDNHDFTNWQPSEKDKETYRLMYEKAKENEPTNYDLMGCIRPEKL